MNLIYSCVFVSKQYIKLLENLLISYNLNNKNEDTRYLIITCKSFENDIIKICENIGLNYDVWILDICNNNSNEYNIYESTYSRYFIYNYPKIGEFKKILYLDCDILIIKNIHKLFTINMENKFYVLEETADRHCHGSMFSDEEFNQLDKTTTFTSAIILFNNNNVMLSYLNEIYNFIKDFHKKHSSPLPCYDQPIFNRFCIDMGIHNNKKLSEDCINMLGKYGQDKIPLITNYILCHFATNVGDHENKLLRMNLCRSFLKHPNA